MKIEEGMNCIVTGNTININQWKHFFSIRSKVYVERKIKRKLFSKYFFNGYKSIYRVYGITILNEKPMSQYILEEHLKPVDLGE